ncbi:hypothetical protein CR513_41598, partial [Mucuna pruriens]
MEVVEFILLSIIIYTSSSCSCPHSHGGAWYLSRISLDRGVRLYRVGLCLSLRLAKTVSDTTQSSLYRIHLCREKKEKKRVVSLSNFQEPGPMENNDRSLKELATPDVVYQPWCIEYSQLMSAQSYELKFSLIHLLPKFHGLVGEDPHKHLKEFHMVCSTMKPQGISKDYIKIKAFPFFLNGAVKDWLYP